MVSSFPPSACVPAGRTLVARGNTARKRTGIRPRPAAFPIIARGRSPGLWDRCVSPSRELALPVARLIRPRHLPLRGQQRHWPLSAAPLSRFTPARGTRRDTSNERVDCTTQVTGLDLAASSGIYIENESLHLDLTGFSKL